MNAARSTFTGGARPKSLTLRLEPRDNGEVFTLETVSFDGRTTIASTVFYFDDKPHEYHDDTCSGTQSSKLTGKDSVETSRNCSTGEWSRFVQRPGPEPDSLSLDMTRQPRSGNRMEWHLLLLRETNQGAIRSTFPAIFEANRGQTDSRVKFYSRGSGYTVFLTTTEAWIAMPKRSLIRLKLLAANPKASAAGQQRLPGDSNYFLGADPSGWRTHVPNYRRVRFGGVYAGVDLVYYSAGPNIEHDFIVAPGADPAQIAFQVTGAGPVELENGDLVVRDSAGNMRLRKPTIYQPAATGPREITGAYTLRADNGIAFDVGPYDHTKPLVIDPVLVLSTYVNGPGGANVSSALALDPAGNIYLAGDGNPEATKYFNNATQSPVVTKLSPKGELVSSTRFNLLGTALAVATDRSGNVYLGGWTHPDGFRLPGTAADSTPGNDDIWIAKLRPDATTVDYYTHVGGTGRDRLLWLAVDDAGNAVAVGHTLSTDFPTAAALQSRPGGSFDGFVLKLNPDGSHLVFSTYLGGRGDDRAYFAVIGSRGDIYISGRAGSADFPLANALQGSYGGGPCDAFVAKLSADGSKLLFSTFLGGSGGDTASGLALDSAGNIYLTGATDSPDFPVRRAIQPKLAGGLDAFVTKLTPNADALLYSTYLGGSGDENALEDSGRLAVDSAGSAWVAGKTASHDFPTADAMQPVFGGGPFDGFLAHLAPDGSALLSATYFGGSADDQLSQVYLDRNGAIYLTGVTGSQDFPLVNAAQTIYGGGAWQSFLAKVAPEKGIRQ